MSCERKYRTTIADLYSEDILIAKFLRFIIPFLIALLIEIGMQIYTHVDITFLSSLHLLFVGGKGPGSYYIPLMIQLIFVFPLIFWIMRQGALKGLIIVGITNLVYEIMVHSYGMGHGCYRLLIFRYLLMIAFGCYLYINRDKNQNKAALLIMLFYWYCLYRNYKIYSVPAYIIYVLDGYVDDDGVLDISVDIFGFQIISGGSCK